MGTSGTLRGTQARHKKCKTKIFLVFAIGTQGNTQSIPQPDSSFFNTMIKLA